MTRLGFIGCGTHASANLYPCVRNSPIELVAICDPIEERLSACARKFGPTRTYADHRELLEREQLDAVFVCGPPAMHHEVSLEAFRRGLHVFVEKPPAPDAAGARQLRDAARSAGKLGMVGFMKRFAQKVQLAESIAASPEFGGLRHMFLRYSHGARMGPHSTHTLMSIHAVDLVRHFMGEVTRVQVCQFPVGEGWSLSMNLDCARGPATLVCQASAPGVKERLELTGDGQMIVVDELATLTHYREGAGIWEPPVGTRYENNFALQTDANSSAEIQGYAGEVRAFIEAVASGNPLTRATLDDAVRAMEIVEAIEHATWEGLEVPSRD